MSRAANLSLSKISIIELEKTYFYVKKGIFTSAKSFRPGSRARLSALEAQGVLGALWCNLSLILEHFYSKTHQFFINNVCKFQNFNSPVKKKKKGKNIFLQDKTYMRIYLAALGVH